MAAFDTFKLWYAASLGSNSFANAASTRKIENSTTPAGEEISLIYCYPILFAKRQVDVSNVLAVDPTSPDTGTAGSGVVLRFAQKRDVTRTVPVLPKLIEMFYLKSRGDGFLAARFGLENTDNPELDCIPVAGAGYKLISFKQEPNQDGPGIQVWEVILKFLGDHTKLGTRS